MLFLKQHLSMDEQQRWYLMKHEDGTEFGPISLEQLKDWAHDAQISPLDRVSGDRTTWVKAPMLPWLEMDYLIEVGPDQYYGPTTLGAIREFIAMGEIGGETTLINACDGHAIMVCDVPHLLPEGDDSPTKTSIRVNLQQRIRDLEELVLTERRGREAAEMRCMELEAKLDAMRAALNS
jgi:hypothetical protein